ncbi:prophage tail fiber N-terminal domain-containing protein [Escherichia coli]|uniref:prophage tail fiber N-terminal domain-containing protein n=1 Tax=Escherichia coli TaxID=562 RepID=UPI0039C8C275
MSVLISGVLTDGTGLPMSEYHIILKARQNTSAVVMRTVATVVTGPAGEYAFEAQTGRYDVYLRSCIEREYCVGDISVYDDSKPGTLNDFLTALDEGDLKPDVVKRFEELVAQAQQSAEAAAESERQAGQHVADAQQIKSDCETLADNVQQNAEDVAEDKKQVALLASSATQDAVATAEDRKATAEDVKSTGANAAAAGQSAQDAAGYARAAEQAKTDIDITLAGTLKTVNHLSEIAAAGEDAQQESRDNLGLTVAATMTPQNDTYDRAEGRLAIPGMFGFGKVFSSGDRTEFKTEADFLRWVKTAKPGRYVVYGADKVIPRVLFSGTVEIIWPEPQTNPNPAYVPKIIIFYGINGHIYYNRYWTAGDGYLVGWENLKVNEASLRALIETRAPLNSPALTGTPSTPTPPDDAAGNEIANAEFVRKLLAALVGSSPEALDTLNELAAALGNDPNFATTVTNALAGKQPLNDTLTSISKAGVGQNSLLYFGDNFEAEAIPCSNKARSLLARNTPESMRTELELKAAATMEPQSDIRDRTPGRLALSGMYGFGQAFTSTDALAFDGQADFAEWLKEVTPGRYAVSIADSSTLLAGTTKFNGIIDVMWSPFDNDESDTTRKFKTLLCFNQYYEGEHSIHRLTYRWSGNNWNATVSPVIYDGDSLAFLLSRTAGSGSYFKYPAVGVPVLAVYRGTTSGDKEIKIGLGDVVPGSQLGGVNLSCTISSAGAGSYGSTPSAGATGYTFPGRYMALSGVRDSYGTSGRICLFVRIE